MCGRNALKSATAMLGNTSFLSIAEEVTYSHHEKWDGSGYPQGLQGDNIPISGRLSALANVYDALLSKGVYKKGFSHQEALKIIKKDNGFHFNPDVADVFLKNEAKFQQIALRFVDSNKLQ